VAFDDDRMGPDRRLAAGRGVFVSAGGSRVVNDFVVVQIPDLKVPRCLLEGESDFVGESVVGLHSLEMVIERTGLRVGSFPLLAGRQIC
jgi:hypothetical protein